MAPEDSESEAATPSAVAAAGLRAGKGLREIAVDLYGREQVDANWHADSAMRSKLRRLLRRVEAGSGARLARCCPSRHPPSVAVTRL